MNFLHLWVTLLLFFTAASGRMVNITGFNFDNSTFSVGGFSPGSNGTCPDMFFTLNNLCWLKNSRYQLQVQNQLIEYYDESQDMKSISGHYVVLLAKVDDRPIPLIPIKISHDGPKVDILLTDGTKKKLGSGKSFSIPTNPDGKAIFTIIASDTSLEMDFFTANVPFLNENVVFNPIQHALYSLSEIDAHAVQAASSNNLTSDEAEKAANFIRQVSLPLLNIDLSDNKDSKLQKRSILFSKVPFDKMKHTIPTFKASYLENTEKRIDFTQIGTEISFFSDSDLIHLHKRSYLSDYGTKLKNLAYSIGNYTKDIFYNVPKATFSRAKDKNSYITNLKEAYSNATKEFVDVTRDATRLLPFGDTISDEIGLDGLVQRLNSSDVIILTPGTAAVELFVLGPKQAWKTLLSSVKSFTDMIKGFFSKIGITFEAIFKIIRSAFNWGDVLMNHRILVAHYLKMVPFMKSEITQSNGNFSNDVSNTVNSLTDVTDQATKMLVNGSFTSLPDLISQANKQIFKNLTDNPQISTDQNYNTNVQSTFITDHFSSNIQSIQMDVSQDDQTSILDVPKEVLQNIAQFGDDSYQSMKATYDNLVTQLSQNKWNFSLIVKIVVELSRFVFEFLIEKAVQAALIVFDFVISVIDKILRTRIQLPFITKLYEQVITQRKSTLTCYDLFALGASAPLTFSFKAFYKGSNMFTDQEANIIIATENPEYYVDNLISFAMQVPDQDPNKLRAMYRRTVSYILGAGYSTGQLFSSSIGFLTTTSFGMYFLRAPFEYLSILCNFPWSWYTDTVTTVGVNIRFLSWFLQFLPIFIGWPSESVAGAGFNALGFIAALSIAIPNIYMVFQVWIQDLMLVGNKSTAIDGSTTLDITLKGTARLVRYFGMILIAVHPFPDEVGITFRTMILSGALLQVARLHVDLLSGSIYSV